MVSSLHHVADDWVIVIKFGIAEKLKKMGGYGDLLALAALVLFIASELLFRHSTLSATYSFFTRYNVLTACDSIVIGLAIGAIAARPRSIEPWQGVLAAILLAALLVSANRVGDYRLVIGCVLIFAVAGISCERLCKAYYCTVIPVLVFVVALSLLGLEWNKDAIPNNRLVFAYGFSHPNTVGALLFSSIGAMTYAHWNRKWVIPFVLSVVAAAFSYVTLSSHAALVLLVLLALLNVVGHIPAIVRLTERFPSKAVFAVMVVVPLCFMTIMLFFTAFYDSSNSVMKWFDSFIHHRPHYAHQYYDANGGFSILGEKYVHETEYHNGLPFTAVDSGFCYVPLVFGLFSMVALFITYVVAAWKISQGQHRVLIACIFLMQALYLLVEIVPLLLALNFSVLFITKAFVGDGCPPGEVGAVDLHMSKEESRKQDQSSIV